MFRILFAVFIVLHGLVYLLYFGHSRRLFELQPGMTWPDASWAFAKLIGNEATRYLAALSCVMAAAGFITAGTGLLLKQEWWQVPAAGSALFSSLMLILLWDGKREKLHDKGLIGVLINLAIAAAVLLFPDALSGIIS